MATPPPRNRRVRPARRRDPRDRVDQAVGRHAADNGLRRQRARHARRVDRSADRIVGRHPSTDRGDPPGVADGHDGRAEAPSRPASWRVPGGQPRDRRYRHPQDDHRRRRGIADRSADAGTDSRPDPSAAGRFTQGPLRSCARRRGVGGQDRRRSTGGRRGTPVRRGARHRRHPQGPVCRSSPATRPST